MKLKRPGVDLTLGLVASRCSSHLSPSFSPLYFPLCGFHLPLEQLLAGELANKDLLNVSVNEPSSLANPGEVPTADVPDGLRFGPAFSCAWP